MAGSTFRLAPSKKLLSVLQGEEGVTAVLKMLREELKVAMVLAGQLVVHEIVHDLLCIPKTKANMQRRSLGSSQGF